MAVLRNVIVRWAQVQAPDTRFEPQWSITAVLNEEQKAQLLEESKSIDPKGKGIKFKEEDDGAITYRFRRAVSRKDGNGENSPPIVCGPKGKNDTFDKLIGNGSVCNIQYSFLAWDNKFGKGVTVDLKGVQVLQHVAYGAQDGDEFEEATDIPDKSNRDANSFDDDDFS